MLYCSLLFEQILDYDKMKMKLMIKLYYRTPMNIIFFSNNIFQLATLITSYHFINHHNNRFYSFTILGNIYLKP